MKKIIFIFFLILSSSSYSQTTPFYRGALLEYFQGHKCPNCPGTDRIADSMQVKYKDSIAIVNIHAGFFASPSTNPFQNDLTTTIGDTLDSLWGVSLYPRGLVSRTNYSIGNSNHLLSKDDWNDTIKKIIRSAPQFLIDHVNNFNSTTKTLNTTTYTITLLNLTGTYYVSVYLTEDSIISPQKNGTIIDPNYVHNNLLRASLNNTWGTLISSGTITSGTLISNNFSYLLNPLWKANKCKTVCFVYDNSNKEVLQISQKYVLDSSSTILSINEKHLPSFDIYPNPTNNFVNIHLQNVKHIDCVTVEIVDMFGKTLLTKKLVDEKINISYFPNGIYFIQLRTEEGVITKKIIKQ